MFGIFESMIFLFPRWAFSPSNRKQTGKNTRELLKNSWRLRELPGTRVRHDLPGYAKPGIPLQLQLWNMQDEELKEHAGRLQESSEVGENHRRFFLEKRSLDVFLQTGDVCLKKNQEMRRKTQGRHYHVMYIHIL